VESARHDAGRTRGDVVSEGGVLGGRHCEKRRRRSNPSTLYLVELIIRGLITFQIDFRSDLPG
jgi:hypothetical protein